MYARTMMNCEEDKTSKNENNHVSLRQMIHTKNYVMWTEIVEKTRPSKEATTEVMPTHRVVPKSGGILLLGL